MPIVANPYIHGFNPAQLFLNSEKGGWWDASDLTTLAVNTDGSGGTPDVGNEVGRWADKVYSNHFVKRSGSPKRHADGVEFMSDGSTLTSLHVTLPANITNSTLSCIMVFVWDVQSPTGGNGFDRIVSCSPDASTVDHASTTAVIPFLRPSDNRLSSWRASGQRAGFLNPTMQTRLLAESIFNGTTAAIYVNGVLGGLESGSTGAFGFDYISIGQQTGSTAEKFDGKIGELIMIDRVLTATETTKMRAYLNAKWSIS